MTADTGSFRHQFTIHQIDVVGIPTSRVAFNAFDEHGLLIGLPRLKGESNASYKHRLLDVFVHRANSTYNGLIYAITRDLGLSLFYGAQINPKVHPDGSFQAADPYIKIDGIYIYLYSDYANGILDYQIDRYEPGGNWEHLIRLVDYINQSAYFEASIETGVDPWTRSMVLMNQSSRIRVLAENVPSTNHFQLEHSRVVSGTLFFSDRNIFATEVTSSALLTTTGEYYVDYQNGIVFSYSQPVLGTTARYSYTAYPFQALASPVILYDINGNFKSKLFKQERQDDGTFVDSIPTRTGVDIINEIMSVYPAYWGK